MLWRYIFFPGIFFIIFSYFGSFMVVLGLGSYIGFWGWGFQLMGIGACGVGPSGFLGWGSLYNHKRMTLGKKWCQHPVMVIYWYPTWGVIWVLDVLQVLCGTTLLLRRLFCDIKARVYSIFSQINYCLEWMWEFPISGKLLSSGHIVLTTLDGLHF